MVKKKEVGKHMRKIIRIFQKVIKAQLSTVISNKKKLIPRSDYAVLFVGPSGAW